MADVYHATHTYDGKPKVVGTDMGNRFGNGNESLDGNKEPVNYQVTGASSTSPGTQVKPPFYKPSSTNDGTPFTNIRCFNCNQVGHTRQQCPSGAQGNSS
jgi:Zinc knuckle